MQRMRLLIAILLVSLVAVSCSERIIEQQVPPPTVTPESGAFAPGQKVKMICSENGAEIRYTLDGSEPNEAANLYTAELTLSVLLAEADSVVVKARAFKPDMNPSATIVRTYKVNYLSTVGTPNIYGTPPGPDITTTTPITIYCGTTGAFIYYTINGPDPTESSTQYTAPFLLSTPGTYTIRARAYKADYNPSEVGTTEFFVNQINIPDSFVEVQIGNFHNGSSYVTVGSFYIAKAEITQAEYQAVMGANPSLFPDPAKPVDNVTWFQAIKYCNLRSMQEGLHPAYSYVVNDSTSFGTDPANWPAGWDTNPANHTKIACNWNSFGYRLPSEMESMFAACGGSQNLGYTYSGSNDIETVAWYSGNSGNTTHIGQTKAANVIGTFDQSGNVDEWVWDIFGPLPTTSQINYYGPTTGSNRGLHGGSWNSNPTQCSNLGGRSGSSPTTASNTNGFRVARKGN